MPHFDAVLIPGGGLTPSGELTPFVRARLDRALAHSADFYIALSAGTTHLPPPLDARGYPVVEAIPAAQYLQERGIPQRRILVESSSYDTIGNAFFTRTIHTDPRGLSRLLIVNSRFHMPRTEAIFRWVFGAAPGRGYDLSFEPTEDIGLSPEALEARAERERSSLVAVRSLASSLATLSGIHQWLFSEHGAYAWFLHDDAYRPATGSLVETYGGEVIP
jgi:uncharacterized SAM-binding protein YcdF (DUF218 family)